jgi:hypothetical protein
MNAFDILKARGVTRLCHFTKFQSFVQIITSKSGVLPSESIRSDIKNATDKARYDGELDYVCCSIEYPNSWFMERAMANNMDKIFRDWLALYVDLDILNLNEAKFCPCNASTGRGQHITDDVNALFANPVRYKKTFCREPDMLSCCPTDGQAEVLIKNGIPRSYIIGLAVGDGELAGRGDALLNTFGG